MRVRGWIVLAVFGLASPSCGPSVQQACDDYAVAWCNQHYTCSSGSSLDQLKTTYGPTPDACAVTYANQANLNCAAAQSICPAGTSYDTGLVEQCVTAYKASSCADILNPSFEPQVASKACNTGLYCH